MSPRKRIPVADRVRLEPSHKDDPLGLVRDAINTTYAAALVRGDDAVRVAMLKMLAHLSIERRAAKIPQFKAIRQRADA